MALEKVFCYSTAFLDMTSPYETEPAPPPVSSQIGATIAEHRLKDIFRLYSTSQRETFVSYRNTPPAKIYATTEITNPHPLPPNPKSKKPPRKPPEYVLTLVDKNGKYFRLEFTRQEPPYQDILSVHKRRGAHKSALDNRSRKPRSVL